MNPEVQLPVIDMSRLSDDAATRMRLARACHDWGVFQLTGHGFSASMIEGLRGEMHAFFAQPLSAKRAIERTAENHWGYFDRELTRNRRDWKEIFDVGPDGQLTLANSRPQWPSTLPGFRPALEAYMQVCARLSTELLGAIAGTLGTRPDELQGYFTPVHTSLLRLNHYPASVAQAHAELGAQAPLGVHEHTDAGALTLLLQDDQPGLQVLHGGEWILVPPRRDALIVTLGDIVQVWSNDRYRAPLHRVVVSHDAQRFTAAYFFNPAVDSTYAPLPCTLSQHSPARYREIHWGEFRATRAAGDYADLGEEIQIRHFAIPDDHGLVETVGVR